MAQEKQVKPIYRSATAWCASTPPKVSQSVGVPVARPPAIFLIRGDRAWGGRPSKLNGGPRSLGRLTVLTPGVTVRHKELRQERNMHRCAENCDGRVTLWNPGQIIASSLFAPGVAAVAALKKWTGWGVG